MFCPAELGPVEGAERGFGDMKFYEVERNGYAIGSGGVA